MRAWIRWEKENHRKTSASTRDFSKKMQRASFVYYLSGPFLYRHCNSVLFIRRAFLLTCFFRAVKLKIVFYMFILWLSVKIIKIPLSRLIFLQGLRSLITKQQKSFRQTLHFDSGYGCYITKVLINLCKMSKWKCKMCFDMYKMDSYIFYMVYFVK